MTTSTLAAEYTSASKARAAVLTLNVIEDGRRTFVRDMPVSGKREARELARAFNATPWNF